MTTGRINQVAAFELSIESENPTEPSDRVPELSPRPPFFRRVCEPPRPPCEVLDASLLFLLTRAFHPGRCVTEVVAYPLGSTRLLAPPRDRPITGSTVPCGSTVPATDSCYLIELLIEYRYKLHRPHALLGKAIARVCDPPTDRILHSELLSNQPSRLSPIPVMTCHRRVPLRHTPFLIDPRPDLPSTVSAHAHQR